MAGFGVVTVALRVYWLGAPVAVAARVVEVGAGAVQALVLNSGDAAAALTNRGIGKVALAAPETNVGAKDPVNLAVPAVGPLCTQIGKS